MAGNIKQLQNDAEFPIELANAGTKLVVADFFATWCGPCRAIAPTFADLSTRYPRAVFLKVDVDQLQETAQRESVSAMPTFIFYRNKIRVDVMRGADPTLLEEKIKKWYTEEEGEEGDSPVKGHVSTQNRPVLPPRTPTKPISACHGSETNGWAAFGVDNSSDSSESSDNRNGIADFFMNGSAPAVVFFGLGLLGYLASLPNLLKS